MRIACANKVQELKPLIEDVNQLRLFPLLDRDETISELQKNLPAYLSEANGVKIDDANQLLWWSNNKNSLPNWSATAKLLALVQLTSAAAEHDLFQVFTQPSTTNRRERKKTISKDQ